MSKIKVSKKNRLELGVAMFRAGVTVRKSADLVGLPKSTLHDELKRNGEVMRHKPLNLDMKNPHIAKIAKRAYFLDIETSTVQGHSFGVGKHSRFTYAGLSKDQETKILSVVYGNLYDLLTKGVKGLHELRADLTETGVDDKSLISSMHKVMDEDMDCLIAHNGNFDKKWLYGRMMLQGLSTPRVSLVDTMSLFRHGNMLCKKLDYLSNRLLGARKISTDMKDWIDIIEGDKREKAMDFMCKYNAIDVYLMVPLYLVGARYNPNTCVDFTDYSDPKPNCRVTGEVIEETGEHINHTTGIKYDTYTNERLGIKYVNRRMKGSKKADGHMLKHHI